MELFPPFSLGWLNGWLPMTLFYTPFFAILKIVPKEIVERLYDNSGWTLSIARPAKIGLPFALAAMILIFFSPLKIGLPIFWIGLALTVIGQAGFIFSLHSFNITPQGEPVTSGLYTFSRNPQWVSFALVLIGFSFLVGSWTVLALLAVRVILNHFRILGEEQALEEEYGESYLSYKRSRRRYL